MMRTLTASRTLLCTAAAFSLLRAAAYAQLPVVSEDYESYALGPFGTVSDFSDASYMSANATAEVVTGQALQFSFDVKSGLGNLNTNVAASFPSPATNNTNANLANYTLEFDAAIVSGTNTGWFGVVEVATPGSGPRTQNLNMGALTVGGAAVHHSMSLADMGQPFGELIDPTSADWSVRLVALGFPADGGGVRTAVRIDNVRVSVIPEPSGLGLIAAAAIALRGIQARRRA